MLGQGCKWIDGEGRGGIESGDGKLGWKHGVTGLKTWLLRRAHCDKRKAAQWKTERFRCGLVDYKRFMETGSERYFG